MKKFYFNMYVRINGKLVKIAVKLNCLFINKTTKWDEVIEEACKQIAEQYFNTDKWEYYKSLSYEEFRLSNICVTYSI